ncbi:hypothetical protein GGR56DRAFT_678903 [Xylariaceae sp. FL0804]|nr:hypothetical protein GGR56DRAFT_678903 [Xylariaceae sp. FL0804]
MDDDIAHAMQQVERNTIRQLDQLRRRSEAAEEDADRQRHLVEGLEARNRELTRRLREAHDYAEQASANQHDQNDLIVKQNWELDELKRNNTDQRARIDELSSSAAEANAMNNNRTHNMSDELGQMRVMLQACTEERDELRGRVALLTVEVRAWRGHTAEFLHKDVRKAELLDRVAKEGVEVHELLICGDHGGVDGIDEGQRIADVARATMGDLIMSLLKHIVRETAVAFSSAPEDCVPDDS